jgi:hypothetical protein
MNCRDIDGVLVEGSLGSPFSTDVEDHVRDCARCQLLVSAPRTSTLTDEPSPVTLVHIESRVIADLRPVRPLRRLYVFAALIAIFVFAVAVAVYRLGAFAITVMSPLQASVILGTLAVCTGLLVSSLVQQIVPGRRHRTSPHLAPAGIMVALAGRNRPVVSFSTGAEFLGKRLGLSEDRDIPRSHCCCAALAGTPPRRHSVSRLDRIGSRTARGSGRHEFPRAALPEPACRAYPGVSPRGCSVRR